MGTIAENKEIRRNFEILETLEAGVVLSGPEVKSAKHGNITLKGSFVTIDAEEKIYVVSAHISPYKPAKGAQKNYDPTRRRQLLITKKQAKYLRGKLTQKGLTIVPLRVYTVRSLIKMEIALVKGLKKADKREKLKKRDIDRDTKREIKKLARHT